MNRGLDIDRILDDWLALGPDELSDLVLDRVANDIDGMRQRGRAWPLAGFGINRLVLAGTVAGALMVAAVFGLTFLSGRNSGGPEATLTPSPAALVERVGILEPGTYFVDEPFPVRVTFAVPEDWQSYGAHDQVAGVWKGGDYDVGLSLWIVDNLPADGCEPELGELNPPVGPTVDDLATALAQQPGYLVQGPVDVTVDGYRGRYLELTGQGLPEGGCFLRRTWVVPGSPTDHERVSAHLEADRIWIVDVDGTRLVIDAFWIPDVSEADLAELQAIVDSIRIDP